MHKVNDERLDNLKTVGKMCRLLRKGNLYNLESLDHIVMLLKNPSLLPSLKKKEVSDHLRKNFEINDIDITLSKIHKLTK